MLVRFIYFIILFVLPLKAGRIIIFQCVQTMSYVNFMTTIVETLATEHEITYISTIKSEFNNSNITFKEIKLPYVAHSDVITDLFEYKLQTDDNSFHALKFLDIVSKTGVFDLVLESDALKDVFNNKEKFDLMITMSIISEYLFPLANYLKVPLVQVHPSIATPNHHAEIGNPSLITRDDSFILSESSDTLVNRFIRFIKYHKYLFVYYNQYYPSIEKSVAKYYPKGTATAQSMAQNTSVFFVNSFEAMGHTRPVFSNYVQVGGLSIKPIDDKKLPKDLKDFIEGGGDHGIIYFSFGNTIQTTIPQNIINSFVNVFRRLKQRVVWKTGNNITDAPANIKISKWYPQQNVLAHNTTKLFIMQGGMLSVQESVFYNVPVLIIPLFFDQYTNGRMAQKMGYGRMLTLTQLSEKTLEKEINEILYNTSYKNTAKKISTLIKDEHMSSRDKIKWWISYLIRHQGYPIFRDREQNWNQVIEIEIMLVLICITLFFIILFYIFIMLFIRFYKTSKGNIKIKTK